MLIQSEHGRAVSRSVVTSSLTAHRPACLRVDIEGNLSFKKKQPFILLFFCHGTFPNFWLMNVSNKTRHLREEKQALCEPNHKEKKGGVRANEEQTDESGGGPSPA